MYQINFKLNEISIIFINNVFFNISLFILVIIKPTSLVGNISRNNSFQFLFNNNSSSSLEYGLELINFAKIYINKVKYNGKNNNFIFKLKIFYDIYTKVNIL